MHSQISSRDGGKKLYRTNIKAIKQIENHPLLCKL